MAPTLEFTRRHISILCGRIDQLGWQPEMVAIPTLPRSQLQLGFLGLVIAIPGILAQPTHTWRYFTSSDGLVESYVGAVSVSTDSRVLITHGQVANMSVFDGFSIRQLLAPGIDARVEEAPSGELWALDAQSGQVVRGFQVYSDGEWKHFPVSDIAPPDPDFLLSAVGAQLFLPLGRGRVLYLAGNGLHEFDSSVGNSRLIRVSGCEIGQLRSLARSRTFGLWLAGEHGLGRAATDLSDDGVLRCQPWGGSEQHRWHHFSNLFDDGDAVFASARADLNSRVALRAGGAHIEVLSRTGARENRVCAWSAGGRTAWILRVERGEQGLFLRSAGGEEAPAPKSKFLSGRITDIAVQPGGVSWIAGVLGLARAAPPVWQPLGPPAVADHRITAIVETPDKDLVFLGENSLWILSGSRWIERALPVPAHLNTGFSNRMAVLGNGKIAIPIRPSGETVALLVYDRRRDRFERPIVAGYSFCNFVAERAPDRAWVACQNAGGGLALFSFDGAAFERAFDLPSGTAGEWPRSIIETRDHSIWVGAFWRHSLFRYAHGSLETIDLPNEVSGMGISDIAELPDGSLWVGGRNLVLERSGRGWSFVRSNLETVRRIYQTRNGSVWIAAGGGVTRCRDDGCVLQGIDEGLPEGVAWTMFEDSFGRLLIGSTAGVRFLNSAADPDPPRVELPSKLNVGKFAPSGEVRFVPAAADRWSFTPSGRLPFSYRVDSGSWSPFDDLTVVSLTGMAGGNHTVEVRAMDRNFNISQPASFQFQVLVAWYRQPAWIVSLFVGICILTFSIYQHVSRHRELQYAVASTTRTLQHEFEEHSRTHARFESILDHAPTSIYVKDLQGRYLVSNLRHCEVMGRSREQIIGKTDEQIFGTAAAVAPFRTGESEALSEANGIQVEETDTRSSRTYLSLKFPLLDERGEPNAICGISTDITESQRIRERIQTSQRLESVGFLAGGIAHDFNNLLTVINGYSELLLKRTESGSRLHDGIAQIRSAGERAAGLTSQLLAFSRKQIVQRTILNPGDLISELDKLLRRLIGEDIELITHVRPNIGNVVADATQVQQILMNLVLNARDAMPHGGRLLVEAENAVLDNEYVNQHPDALPGEYVMLAVSDTGTGMTPEVQARVFEPFFTTKELGKGTGLGLASVYGMVKQSGGWIWVYSEPGRGTTFKVYLPRTNEASIKKEIAPKADVRGSENILVVEDQSEVRALAATALQKYGYTVYEAGNGPEALSFCSTFNGRIDLLLTDVVMPGMNGHELARQVAQLRPNTKVLYMSGYTEHTITHQGLPGVESRYLQKPFTPDSLVEKVREALDAGPSIGVLQ